ncbi:MAG: hypothetical protein H6R38_119 [Deltaproteobacteria bacterium]|jgi:hypothetical protein|nr:hypothetical protein [Deltaproteobacteria bacterium]
MSYEGTQAHPIDGGSLIGLRPGLKLERVFQLGAWLRQGVLALGCWTS